MPRPAAGAFPRQREDGVMSEDASLDVQQAAFERFPELAGEMGARRLQDVHARIVEKGDRRAVAMFFSHLDSPGTGFAYLAKAPGDDRHEAVWLAEEFATGALHRLVRDASLPADDEGIVWLHLHGQALRAGS